MAEGSGAAYLQLQVPQDGLNQSLQTWGRMEGAKRAQEQDQENKAKARRAKQLEKYGVTDLSGFETKDGGFNDLNSANRALADSMVQEYSNLKLQATKAYNNNNVEEADRLNNLAYQIENKFKNTQETMATHKANFEGYQKDFTEGKVSGWSKGFGNYYKGKLVDGKYNMKYVNGNIVEEVSFIDQDGNVGTQIVSDKDVQNGNFRYYLKQDVQKDTTDIAKSLGDTVIETNKGYFTEKNIKFGPKQETAAREMLLAKLGSNEYMADMVDQFDLYDEFDIDEANPPAIADFTDEQRNTVADRLLESVKGKYKEVMEKEFNAQRYAADTRRQIANQKRKTPEDEAASQLKYDVTRAVNDGDYTILKRRFKESKNGIETSVRDVVKSKDGNSLILYMENGDPVTIANSEPAITEFVLRNSPEYRGITPQKVIGAEPLAYRGGSIQASGLEAALSESFDEEGNVKKIKDIPQTLRKLGYDVDYESNTFSPDVLTINGKKIKISRKAKLADLVNQIEQATTTRVVTKSGNNYE